jgi:uncharacterized membrane protein YgdD (TMEM256/DUF423 family)
VPDWPSGQATRRRWRAAAAQPEGLSLWAHGAASSLLLAPYADRLSAVHAETLNRLLAPRCARRVDTIALFALLMGTLLFSGSLAGAYAFGWPTALAPLGGSTMIAAWLLYAADALRR